VESKGLAVAFFPGEFLIRRLIFSKKKGESMSRDNNNQNSNTGASMAPSRDAATAVPDNEPKIDDRGTDQSEALQILTSIKDGAFDGSNEKLALALGRPTEEIEEWIEGAGTIDGDVVQKARTLAIERGFQIE
jgi:hypothetical protein